MQHAVWCDQLAHAAIDDLDQGADDLLTFGDLTPCTSTALRIGPLLLYVRNSEVGPMAVCQVDWGVRIPLQQAVDAAEAVIRFAARLGITPTERLHSWPSRPAWH